MLKEKEKEKESQRILEIYHLPLFFQHIQNM